MDMSSIVTGLLAWLPPFNSLGIHQKNVMSCQSWSIPRTIAPDTRYPRMLPPFSSRKAKLKSDLARLDENYKRFRALVEGLTEEQMAKPVTEPNPHNNFPGLTLLELIERSSGHESTHSRLIVETRNYVEPFAAKERAVTFIVLDPERPSNLGVSCIGLMKHADYVAGTAEARDAVRSSFMAKSHTPESKTCFATTS